MTDIATPSLPVVIAEPAPQIPAVVSVPEVTAPAWPARGWDSPSSGREVVAPAAPFGLWTADQAEAWAGWNPTADEFAAMSESDYRRYEGFVHDQYASSSEAAAKASLEMSRLRTEEAALSLEVAKAARELANLFRDRLEGRT